MSIEKQSILNQLEGYGPSSFAELRRRQVDLDCSDTRPLETRAEIKRLLEEGLIERIEDDRYRAKSPVADFGGRGRSS